VAVCVVAVAVAVAFVVEAAVAVQIMGKAAPKLARTGHILCMPK
jgi:hypothetical protein